MRLPRPIAIAAGVSSIFALAGCTAPDYYLTAVIATYTFASDEYNATRGEEGLAAMNLTTTRSPSRASGESRDFQAALDLQQNGTFTLNLHFVVNDHTGTQRRALERAGELQAEKGILAVDSLAKFEATTGWRHTGGPEWQPVTLHGD